MCTPTMVANLNWKCYLIFMAFSFSFLPMLYLWYPETTRLSLEEIDYLFLSEDDMPPEAVAAHGQGAVLVGKLESDLEHDEGRSEEKTMTAEV